MKTYSIIHYCDFIWRQMVTTFIMAIIIHANIKSCSTPKINIILYINYTSNLKRKKRNGNICIN